MRKRIIYNKIPFEVCVYVVSNSLYNPFRLYVYLKTISDGKLRIDQTVIQAACEVLGFKCTKSVRKNLMKLQDMNWVGYNVKSGYYFIRGYDSLRRQYGFYDQSAAEIDVTDISKLKESLAAALIGKLINYNKKKLIGAERKNGRSNQTPFNLKGYYPISASYLAAAYNISINKAFRLKLIAKGKRMINVKKWFEDTGFNSNQIKQFKLANPDIAHKVIVRQGKLLIQREDLIKSTIHFGRRKKIESL